MINGQKIKNFETFLKQLAELLKLFSFENSMVMKRIQKESLAVIIKNCNQLLTDNEFKKFLEEIEDNPSKISVVLIP